MVRESVVFEKNQLKREEKLNPGKSVEISKIISLGRKICLQGYVISDWRLEEEIEDIYTLSFQFKKAVRTQNLKGGYSHYQVQKNSDGIAVLVRVPE